MLKLLDLRDVLRKAGCGGLSMLKSSSALVEGVTLADVSYSAAAFDVLRLARNGRDEKGDESSVDEAADGKGGGGEDSLVLGTSPSAVRVRCLSAGLASLPLESERICLPAPPKALVFRRSSSSPVALLLPAPAEVALGEPAMTGDGSRAAAAAALAAAFRPRKLGRRSRLG